ncbi:polyprenyl synthetase family protein [Marseilla massiliensis]|uniref:Polyprenyl synthetase family protein n=1 Tax=Marseilla massiliensis TaxID=1841864 RepID=A0A939B3P8_9BACT|nr:polyprenyl synthetase family protein [Marseilla massiliensis]MBM6660252.1 polyprenyl synthetase family protein [Marseilla massiliensis]MCL1609398.1 polyprenyl synthetase family protein [Marseilla massiliensis]HIV82980.1 polyprenyl synthetase family protein [Candidatus Prevotella intestinigallinarum]
MDYLSLIRKPIEGDLGDFNALFDHSLSHTDGMLSQALAHIRQKTGKRMRPMLILLMARNYGAVTDSTLNAAVGLELLHTASLVHDDVVDESGERRGQASLNATYNNKVAVLVGDYLLSTALLHVAYTGNKQIVQYLAELGRTLASGEILQLSNIRSQGISEDVYYQVIRQKTAALFEACCAIGALSAGAAEADIVAAKEFGCNLGMIFQIRDDIFDYFESADIGKPTGNDMAEGKLTLPVIYALNTVGDEAMFALARKVKEGTVTADEIAVLVDFTKKNGGIEYAQRRMDELRMQCDAFIRGSVGDREIGDALTAYVDFVIRRTK